MTPTTKHEPGKILPKRSHYVIAPVNILLEMKLCVYYTLPKKKNAPSLTKAKSLFYEILKAGLFG